MHNFNKKHQKSAEYRNWKRGTRVVTLFALTLITLAHIAQIFSYLNSWHHDQQSASLKNHVNNQKEKVNHAREQLEHLKNQWNAASSHTCQHSCCGLALFTILEDLQAYTITSASASNQGTIIHIDAPAKNIPQIETLLAQNPLSPLIQAINISDNESEQLAHITLVCNPTNQLSTKQ